MISFSSKNNFHLLDLKSFYNLPFPSYHHTLGVLMRCIRKSKWTGPFEILYVFSDYVNTFLLSSPSVNNLFKREIKKLIIEFPI